MLEELDIRNLGPIREATIVPASGMTAITGETGAGKSMLLSAIRLISGDAAAASRVSPEASQAWAQGIFALAQSNEESSVEGRPMAQAPSPGDARNADDGYEGMTGSAAALHAARQAGVEPEDGELFLTRTVPASGRSRAVLGGKTVPRSVLASVAGELVTIHGQSDQLRIASAARQREFLDQVADDAAELHAYRKAWEALAAMDNRLERLKSQESSVRAQADYLRESIERINRADPHPGEDDELKAARERIENAAEIAQGVGSALAALDASQVDVDSDGVSAVDLITRASQSLRAIHVGGSFAKQADRLDSINADLSDVVFALGKELGGEASLEDLDRINDRIHELGELTRRWGPELSDVIAWRDQAVFDVEDLDASPEKVAQLESERVGLAGKAIAAAKALSDVRKKAAKALGERVTAELASLAMAGASLEVRVTPRRPDEAVHDEGLGPWGLDEVAFLFTPFEGSPQLPMGKSASGGELSRLMLALELAAADARGAGDGQTFIFDEVDAGVGGKAAVELGRRLSRLAAHAQVIVVTHLAQVASWADAQYVVAKTQSGQGVSTAITAVEGEARVHEIARMLSGSESEASLDHARELLAVSKPGAQA